MGDWSICPRSRRDAYRNSLVSPRGASVSAEARRWVEWADRAIDEIDKIKTKEAWVAWVTENCVELSLCEEFAPNAWEDVRASNHIKASRLWRH